MLTYNQQELYSIRQLLGLMYFYQIDIVNDWIPQQVPPKQGVKASIVYLPLVKEHKKCSHIPEYLEVTVDDGQSSRLLTYNQQDR